MKIREPRILFWDIETSLELVAVFDLKYNDFIDPANLVTERYVICASWKWAGEKTIHHVSVLDNPKLYAKEPANDRHVIETLHNVLSSADIIVAHNGDQFDTKYVETRILFHGLSPLPPIPSIDTCTTAKNRFKFNSNKLDYLGSFLNVGRKKPTTTGLWLRVLQGDVSAIREMVRYNIQDVALLERVFIKLRPYITNHLNRQLLGHNGCPRCGSTKIQARGVHRAVTRLYHRFQCQSCGGWFKQQKPVSSTQTRTL